MAFCVIVPGGSRNKILLSVRCAVCGAGLFISRGIFVIICIFLPMDNGVILVLELAFQCAVTVAVPEPFVNRVALLRHTNCRTCNRCGGCDRVPQVKAASIRNCGCHVVAAVGIKCDLVKLVLTTGKRGNAGCNVMVSGCIAALRGAPADNAFIFAHGEPNLGGRGVQNVFTDRFTGCALRRCGKPRYRQFLIQEVHVAVLLKLRRNGHFRAADIRDCAEV